jgi:formylglycine-generating enzyme required for sulfatase activity
MTEMSAIELEWVTIPAGNFLMGTPSDQSLEMASKYDSKYFLSESPQRKVFLDAFEISAYPVTNRQYKKFVDMTGYNPGAWLTGYSEDKLDHPATGINYYDALAFCGWSNCRLPTAIEWEKAARGPEGLEYPWGNDWQADLCNNRENIEKGSTTPVMSYPQGKSVYGAYDMAGNVWEWTSATMLSERTPAIWWAWNDPTWLSEQRSGNSSDGYDYLDSETREWYILKGGGADSNRWGTRCAFQLIGYEARTQGDFFGFRCVKLY